MGEPVLGCSGAEEAAQARGILSDAGVDVGPDGRVVFTKDATDVYMALGWSSDQDLGELAMMRVEPAPMAPQHATGPTTSVLARKLTSRVYKHLDAFNAARLWHAADKDDRVLMLASGGRGAGAVWAAVLDRRADWFTTSHFRVATQLRLGVFVVPRNACCKLVKRVAHPDDEGTGRTDAGRICGQQLGPHAAHALVCKSGPATMRPHRMLANTLAREMRAVGAEVDLERVIPELADRRARSGQQRDAVMDLAITFPASLAQLWVDVSIRCPSAARYVKADRVAGTAAAVAAEEKHDRYGPYVLPLPFESFGRLGTAGRRTLEVLALHAAACVHDKWAAQRLVPRWHACLERVVTFATAEIVLLSMGTRMVDFSGT